MEAERAEAVETAPPPQDRAISEPPERNLTIVSAATTGLVPIRMEAVTEKPHSFDGETAVEVVGRPGSVVRPARREPHPAAHTSGIGDRIFNAITAGFAGSILVILAAVIGTLVIQSRESISKFGFAFLTGQTWDPINNIFGAAPAILGTVYTSLLALLFAAPVGIMVAIFLTEIAPRRIRFSLGFVIELLAAVPSIVYGLWALFVLVPIVREDIQPFFANHFGNTPLFSGYPLGLGFFTASLILSVMVLPTITSISRDVMMAVPNAQRDAMLALGATRWETTWKSVIPYARSGIIGAIMLALGRAIGETMAVQMVIGNTFSISSSLFATGTTMPATIVSQFQDATSPLHQSSLIELALILMLVTLLLNAVARLLVARMSLGSPRQA
jgi:phosphate transport system permease protein